MSQTYSEQREREQRKIRWNGMQKYGSYAAYDDELLQRKHQRKKELEQMRLAMQNGEFIQVKPKKQHKTRGSTKPSVKENVKIQKTLFSHLNMDDEEDSEEEEPVVTSKPTVTSKPLAEKKKTKISWFDMCESDDED